jgi:flagellar basal body P-ring formation protein FlgA
MIRILTLAFATLTALGTAASAAEREPPRLKSEATVTGDIVRIGDLVENAGIVSKVAIFRAPDLGSTGTVPAEAVIEAVRTHALVGLDAGNVTEVTVTRASRTIPAASVEATIAQALSAQYALGPAKDITINFERELRAIQVEPTAVGEPRVAHIDYDKSTSHFDVTLSLPTGAGSRGSLRLSGHAAATAEIVTVVRPLERGEILKAADIAIERRPRADVTRDIVTDSEHALGLAARAALQPGRPIRASDLVKPPLVQRNETVTLIYEVPGIMLTVRGKAADAGAEGDVISVINEQTKRAVQGVVVGPGRVVISTASPRLAANIQPTNSNGR